jgi:ABC-2 type transport system permease protein
MLWYKAWLETRARFLLSLLGLVVLPSLYVYNGNQVGRGISASWFYRDLHFGHNILSMMWAAAVTLLMMGGLLREKAVGTSSFTLSLPVSRERLMGVRIGCGFLQAMVLVIIPWAAMFVTAATTGKANSVYQAMYHVVLLSTGGLVFFGIALLVSSLVEGEYTAPVLSLGILFADAIAMSREPFRFVSPWRFMMGSEYVDPKEQMFNGPIPWMHAAASVLFAALLIAAAIAVIKRREF